MGLKTVSYSEILGNRFNLKPKLEMLNEDGWRKVKMVNLEGCKKRDQLMAEVHYDRDYVIQYFARQLEHLRELPTDEIRKIIGEAKREAKQIFNEREDLGRSEES